MEYNGKKALVCGMARSGIAAAKLLNRLGARVTLQDMKKREEISADVLALEGEGIVLCLRSFGNIMINVLNCLVRTWHLQLYSVMKHL